MINDGCREWKGKEAAWMILRILEFFRSILGCVEKAGGFLIFLLGYLAFI